VDWKNYHIVVQEPQVVHVTDVRHDHVDKLEFRDPVMRVSLQYSRLVIATTTQCLIYDIQEIHTPHSFDLKGTVSLIMQAPKVFMLVSGLHGVQFYTYDGRLLSQPKLPGIRPEFFNAQNVAISDEVFAFVDRGQQKLVRFFSISTGKALDTLLKHSVDVCEIAMSNSSKGKDVRMVTFVDRNRDMYIFDMNYLETQKLATMVDSLRWCEDCDVLVCISDDKLVTWLYPRTVFVDRDLAGATRQESDARFVKVFHSFTLLDAVAVLLVFVCMCVCVYVCMFVFCVLCISLETVNMEGTRRSSNLLALTSPSDGLMVLF
jgi:intraflagellar transport protein 80